MISGGNSYVLPFVVLENASVSLSNKTRLSV